MEMSPHIVFYSLPYFLASFLILVMIFEGVLPSILCFIVDLIARSLLVCTITYHAEALIVKIVLNQKLPSQNKAVLITGCGTGFGHALAKRLDSKGFQVFAGCLNPLSDGSKRLKQSSSNRLHVLGLDVTKDESVQKALEYVKKHLNGMELWALVNNAGRAKMFEITWTKMQDFQKLVDVNTMGTIRVTKAFLPLLRESKGRIVNVSSLAARHPLYIDAAYSMSKAATSAFSTCLGQEMQPWGVKVITVEPEFFRTNLVNYELHHPEMESSFKCLDQDVKAEYGKEYLQSFSTAIKRLLDIYSDQVDRVVDVLEDTVSLEHPKDVYKPCRNIFVEFMVYLSDFLPQPIMDIFLRSAYSILGFPIPQEASCET